MKRTFAPYRRVVIMSAVALMVALTSLIIAGCGGSSGNLGGGGTPPPTVSITATPTSIVDGQSSKIAIVSSNATSCTGTNALAGVAVPLNGVITTVSPTATSVYGVTCSGDGGSTSASVTVTVTAASQVVITATGPAIMARGIVSTNYVVAATVTGATNTGYTCSSENANLAIVDPATCVVTPSDLNSGIVNIDATAAADTTKVAKVAIQVGEWMLLGGPQGQQFWDGDGIGSPITIFTHAQELQTSNGCTNSSVQRDLHEFVCLNGWSNGPTVVDVYKTNGTANGTTLATEFDFSLAKYGSLGQIVYPSWSPDGENILFVSDNGSVQSIYIIAADGTKAPVDLYDGPSSMVAMLAPHYTPDGKSITFQRVTDNTVWIMGADGKNPHQLLTAPSEVALYTKDMKTIYYSDGVSTFVAGDATPLFSGYFLLGISPDEKTLLLLDGAAGQTYLGSVQGGTPTKIGTGGWGSF